MNDEFNRPELPSIGILSLMQDEDRALLSNYGEFIPGHPGTTVIAQGEPQDSLYFLISGLLHVTGGWRDGFFSSVVCKRAKQSAK